MSQPGGRGNKDDKGKGIAADPVPDEQSPASRVGVMDDSTTDGEDDATSEAPTTLDLLSALEDSLPMKRSLSRHYTGKAKSFGNLADICVEDPKELSKNEHPVNKKQRLLIAHEIRIGEMKGGGDSSANVPQPSAEAPAPGLPSDDDQKNEGDQGDHDDDNDDQKNKDQGDDGDEDQN